MSAEIIFNYLREMRDKGASDIYLTVGAQPMMRINDEIQPIEVGALTSDHLTEILGFVLTARQRHEFDSSSELNTALDLGEVGRFRVNVLKQRQNIAMVIRRIVTKIPSFEELKLPKIYSDLAMEKRGLILVVGMTGAGKSTSLASMIDHRNSRQKGHIITIEDPIEYYHEHKQSVVTQREIGVDTSSYKVALKNALRQRPDVILIGEIRDREVMEQALMSAETGHLCLATVHANNAYQAIERVVNFFPEDQLSQVRTNLSLNLKATLSQRLLPSITGSLVPVLEVMLNQGLIRELILKGEIQKIRDIMEENTMSGMRSFDQSLLELYGKGEISEEVAINNADRPSDLKVKLKKKQLSMQEQKSEKAVLDHIDTSFLTLRD